MSAAPLPPRVAALVAALALGGCSAGGGVRENPDGTLSIDCAGGYYDWTACHARAERACGQYEIVARVSNEGSSGVGTRDWSAEGSVVTRTLVVRCRG